MKAEDILVVTVVQIERHLASSRMSPHLIPETNHLHRQELNSGEVRTHCYATAQRTDTQLLTNVSADNLTPFRSPGHYLAQQRKYKSSFAASTPVPNCCLIRVTDFRIQISPSKKILHYCFHQ